MSAALELESNRASAAQIAAHLRACDDAFVPPLGARVDIDEYARKIAARAHRIEAFAAGELAGLVAVYCDDPQAGAAFITSVSVLPAWRGRGLASRLLARCLEHVRALGFGRIELELDPRNAAAGALYRKHGFAAAGAGRLAATLDTQRTEP